MQNYLLAARDPEKKPHTTIQLKKRRGSVTIGEGYCTIIAGPCAVESREGYLDIALQLKEIGVDILRGGAFKPRTSPYSFHGLGEEGLRILAEARDLTGLPVVSEVLDVRDLDLACRHLDILQVGSRNMQNFTLLQEIGRVNKPVILKRGFAATIEEWLLAAEYILNAGNEQVILCERGIRSFEPLTRNTIDIGAVSLLKELSHLPVLLDPSHGTGRKSMIRPVSRAALAVGADGIMVEVHQDPEKALSDGDQSLTPLEYQGLLDDVQQLAQLYHKRLFCRTGQKNTA